MFKTLKFMDEQTLPKIKPYVKQHWNITFSGQKKVSVVTKRILAILMASIRDNDEELESCYQMHVKHVIPEENNLSGAFYKVKKSFNELTNLKWLIENIGENKFYYRHLIDTTDIRCGYDNGGKTL